MLQNSSDSKLLYFMMGHWGYLLQYSWREKTKTEITTGNPFYTKQLISFNFGEIIYYFVHHTSTATRFANKAFITSKIRIMHGSGIFRWVGVGLLKNRKIEKHAKGLSSWGWGQSMHTFYSSGQTLQKRRGCNELLNQILHVM